ncbi:hypothetical protein HYU22_02360 [Candidatus Woesearchaeota archaeon]|nr:hypothetical protein [Candidatus Woesearchaeota archaeon]
MTNGITLPTAILMAIIISVLLFIAGISFLYTTTRSIQEKTILPMEEPEKSTVQQTMSPDEPALENITTADIPEIQRPPDCRDNYSCDFYFIFVPVGNWTDQKIFESVSKERSNFFIDISLFKFKKVGVIFIPVDFAQKCNVNKIHPAIARDHLTIKRCADKYVDMLGIDYERTIGIANEYVGGRAFFNSKSAYVTLGFKTAFGQQETPSLAAHELGHTYNLCDEYSQKEYNLQNHYLQYQTCRNQFPAECKSTENCLGNTPTYRDYSQEDVFNVCQGQVHYSVMGPSTSAECGYDTTGGYEAIGEVT